MENLSVDRERIMRTGHEFSEQKPAGGMTAASVYFSAKMAGRQRRSIPTCRPFHIGYGHSERKKLSKSCCWLAVRPLNWRMT